MPLRQAFGVEHGPPLGKAVGPQRGIEQDATGREEPAEAFQGGGRIGQPMKRHAGGDDVEPRMPARLAGIHHLVADTRAARRRDCGGIRRSFAGPRRSGRNARAGSARPDGGSRAPCRSRAQAHGGRRSPAAMPQAAPLRSPASPHGPHSSRRERRNEPRFPRYGGKEWANSRTLRAHQSGCVNGRTWPPSGDHKISCPRHMASVMAGGTMASSREPRASMGHWSVCFNALGVPMHQPIETFIEPGDIEPS